MSLLWTESFAAFERFPTPMTTDLNDSEAVAYGNRIQAALSAFGYTVNAPNAALTRPAVISDPVIASRAGLASLVGNSFSSSAYWELQIPVPQDVYPIVFGFSLYVPTTYVPPASGTDSMFQALQGNSGVSWNNITKSPGSNFDQVELFRVTPTLEIRDRQAPATTLKLQPGAMAYFEVRVNDSFITVWCNNQVVLSKTSRYIGSIVSLRFYQGASGAATTRGWTVGNFYLLNMDDKAPNNRLGATTRVIGKRPASDVKAEFFRPGEYESNAEVAGLDAGVPPLAALRATAPGKEDIYELEEDIDTANAMLVHGVAVKSLATNLDVEPHNYKPFILTTGDAPAENEDDGVYAFRAPDLILGSSEYITAFAEHPTKGIVFGTSAGRIFYSEDDGETWDEASVSGTPPATSINGIAVAGNGTMMVVFGNTNDIAYCKPADDISDWTYQELSGGNGTSVDIAASNSTFVIACTTTASDSKRILVDSNGDISSVTSFTLGIATHAVTHDGTRFVAVNNGTVGSGLAFRVSTDDGVTWGNLSGSVALSNGTVWKKYLLTLNGRVVVVFNSTAATYVGIANESTGAMMNAFQLPHASDRGQAAASNGRELIIYGSWRIENNSVYNPVMGLIRSTDGATFYGHELSFGVTNSPQDFRVFITSTGRVFVSDSVFEANARLRVSSKVGRAEKTLPVLGGYKAYYNLAQLNPETGEPWTPEEAAAVRIGVRAID